MKIEKVSDTQIRCILNKQDLADRELKLSEFAYGSDKAKALFHELMTLASYEYGFEADDIPLMIEAIPVSPESLVLVVTKVEDPDELDTRFSNFSSSPDSASEENDELSPSDFADQLLECFGRIGDLLEDDEEDDDSPADTIAEGSKAPAEEVSPELTRVFSFPSLKAATTLSGMIAPYYSGENTLLKDPSDSRYYLLIHMSAHSPGEFGRICNTIAEYGTPEPVDPVALSYYEEHFTPILRADAVQTLAIL